jgi:hypothetical protein
MASTVAVLDIMVRAQTRQALAEMRRVDSTVSRSGSSATKATKAVDKHVGALGRMGRAATSAVGYASGFVGVYGLVNVFKDTVAPRSMWRTWPIQSR